jgi:hypothetical protein
VSGAVLILGQDLKSQILERLPFDRDAAVAARDLVPHFPHIPIAQISRALSMLHKWPDVKRQKTSMRTVNGGCTVLKYWRLPP